MKIVDQVKQDKSDLLTEITGAQTRLLSIHDLAREALDHAGQNKTLVALLDGIAALAIVASDRLEEGIVAGTSEHGVGKMDRP